MLNKPNTNGTVLSRPLYGVDTRAPEPSAPLVRDSKMIYDAFCRRSELLTKKRKFPYLWTEQDEIALADVDGTVPKG
jgi:hypothetical protein